MDFGAFCTFCAAWEQRHTAAAVRYFFQVLDLEGRGHLTAVSRAWIGLHWLVQSMGAVENGRRNPEQCCAEPQGSGWAACSAVGRCLAVPPTLAWLSTNLVRRPTCTPFSGRCTRCGWRRGSTRVRRALRRLARPCPCCRWRPHPPDLLLGYGAAAQETAVPPNCAELRIEDVIGDVVDLAQAADPRRITPAGGRGSPACRMRERSAGSGQQPEVHQALLCQAMVLCLPAELWCARPLALAQPGCSTYIPHPATPRADLQRCGAAGTIIGLLADVKLFFEYENREQMLAQAAAAAQEQEEAERAEAERAG